MQLCSLRTCINPVNFVTIAQGNLPIRGSYNGKILNFQDLGGRKPTALSDVGLELEGTLINCSLL